MDRTSARWLPDLLFVAVVLVAFADPLVTGGTFGGRDLYPYNLPVEHAMHAAWSRGAAPVWGADFSGGRPLLPNPNLGALYPVRPLLSVLPFPAAFRVYPVLHWILAGLGMARLLRALGAGPWGGFVGAAMYAFSGVGISEVFYSNQQPGMALLPWIVWAAVRPAQTAASRVLPLALVFGLDFLAGDVFGIGIALGACALWILVETPRAEWMKGALHLAGALVLAALLAAPQIVASVLWAPLTHRAIGGIPLKVAVSFSVPPARLLELVVPFPFGATWLLDAKENWGRGAFRDFFSTLFCGGLALYALVILRRLRSPGARFAIVLAAAAAALCVLPSFVPAAWGDWRSPVPLRYPEKLSVALVFALALAAGIAVERFRARRVPAWIGIAVAAVLTAVALLARTFPAVVGGAGLAATGASGATPAGAGLQIGAAFAEGGLLWIATVVGLDWLPHPGKWRTAAAVALLAAVPILANRRAARTFPEQNIFTPPNFARFAAKSDPGRRFRALDVASYRPQTQVSERTSTDPEGNDFYRRAWFIFTPSLWGRGTVVNVDPDVGDLSRMESLRRISTSFPESPSASAFFRSLSLRHAIRFRDQPPLPGYQPVGGDRIQVWDEDSGALPSIRIPGRVRETPGPREALGAFTSLAADEVILETGRSGEGVPSAGTIRDLDDQPERLRFSIAAPAATWVFVLRGFWPYRTVRIDGERVDPVPAQLAFSALPVPGGQHRVDWSEDLPGAPASWAGPVLFFGIGLLWTLRQRPLPRTDV